MNIVELRNLYLTELHNLLGAVIALYHSKNGGEVEFFNAHLVSGYQMDYKSADSSALDCAISVSRSFNDFSEPLTDLSLISVNLTKSLEIAYHFRLYDEDLDFDDAIDLIFIKSKTSVEIANDPARKCFELLTKQGIQGKIDFVRKQSIFGLLKVQ